MLHQPTCAVCKEDHSPCSLRTLLWGRSMNTATRWCLHPFDYYSDFARCTCVEFLVAGLCANMVWQGFSTCRMLCVLATKGAILALCWHWVFFTVHGCVQCVGSISLLKHSCVQFCVAYESVQLGELGHCTRPVRQPRQLSFRVV